jgi:D-glycero-alpha-D-manno-heptose-7-phosphate kinase
MIITRTPFRISFAGGGSDLECFYARGSGAVLSTAIAKYMYLTVTERFGDTFRVSYSRTELVDRAEQIEHPIVRECLNALGIRRGLEIVSVADLPARSGMGSSSSFTVGLLHALYALEGQAVSPRRLAEQACHIEIDVLREPIGKQDQYIAAFGGLRFIRFQPDGQVCVDPVICRPEARRELNRRLLLFFTNQTRDAREVLTKQRARADGCRPGLQRLCQIAGDMRDVLARGEGLNEFGRLLHAAWETKRSLNGAISNPRIDDYYERGLRAGALGGKLLGAGNGGFLLFYCEPHLQCRLRDALEELPLVRFTLEPEGTKVIFVGEGGA